ncbi:MAG: redox-regulated ATPase YchF [Deltaproteobacteria bacterium]|nr:redox-regulated ATPase YchF [Deltaproteobacteria bacterium]
MKLGIIGLPGAGKSTIFAALTGARGEDPTQKGPRSDQRIGTLRVVDERVDFLAALFKPKKTTFAQVEYLLPSQVPGAVPSKSEDLIWNQVRVCDALLHVVRNFLAAGGVAPEAEPDFWRLEEEMILNDLAVAERRVERIELDSKRGNKPNEEEVALLVRCRGLLEKGRPLRLDRELADAPLLRGFTFLSARPELVIMNNDEDDESMPDWKTSPEKVERTVVRGRIEMEIASMPPEEAGEFREEYHIQESALDRVIRDSYELLNLVSFFTVLNDEVRAWTIPRGTPALEAAGTVHSDMKKGFIRAEVVSLEHLRTSGSIPEARKAGHVHLEGKEYIVQDGDIMQFRFNV